MKSLPLLSQRSLTITRLLKVNTAFFAIYLLSPGPYKLNYERRYTATPESGKFGTTVFHFFHTSFAQFLFTSGVFYTIGNYHVTAYGAQSFMRLFGASAVAGSILTAVGLKSGYATEAQAGAMAPAAGLIAYNIFRNPAWFKFLVSPFGALTLLALYGALYKDRAAIGGLGIGYLAFLFGL